MNAETLCPFIGPRVASTTAPPTTLRCLDRLSADRICGKPAAVPWLCRRSTSPSPPSAAAYVARIPAAGGAPGPPASSVFEVACPAGQGRGTHPQLDNHPRRRRSRQRARWRDGMPTDNQIAELARRASGTGCRRRWSVTVYYQDDARDPASHSRWENVLPNLPDGFRWIVITDPPYSGRRTKSVPPRSAATMAAFTALTCDASSPGFDHLTDEERAAAASGRPTRPALDPHVLRRRDLPPLARRPSSDFGLDYHCAPCMAPTRWGATVLRRPSGRCLQTVTVAHPKAASAGTPVEAGHYSHAIVLDRGRDKVRVHATQKPEPLMAKSSATAGPGDPILDAYAGSGDHGRRRQAPDAAPSSSSKTNATAGPSRPASGGQARPHRAHRGRDLHYEVGRRMTDHLPTCPFLLPSRLSLQGGGNDPSSLINQRRPAPDRHGEAALALAQMGVGTGRSRRQAPRRGASGTSSRNERSGDSGCDGAPAVLVSSRSSRTPNNRYLVVQTRVTVSYRTAPVGAG